MTNRLGDETSPYLHQHRDNPVQHRADVDRHRRPKRIRLLECVGQVHDDRIAAEMPGAGQDGWNGDQVRGVLLHLG